MSKDGHNKVGRWFAAALLAGSLLVPGAASAQTECQTDADCDENYICEMMSAPCTDVACEPGEDNCPEQPVCEPQVEGFCVPGPPPSCETAADCDAGLVCVTYTMETCDAGEACNPNEPESCESMPEVPSCTTESMGYCLPPYLAPCEAHADCGPGFECKAQEICSCSGGGSTEPPSPGVPDGDVDGSSGEPGEGSGGEQTPDDTHCECAPSDHKSCEPIKQECQSDADCGADLSCQTFPGYAGDSVIGPDETCSSTPEGGTVCEGGDVEPSEPPSYCLPEGIDRWVGVNVPGYGYGGESTSDPGDGSEKGGSNSPGEVVSASVDRDNPASDPASGGSDDADSGCGCASTGNGLPSPGALATMAALFLGLVGIRRRF